MSLPLWALFILVVMVIYIALVSGFKLATHLKDGDDATSLPPISSVVASLLALLAFLLALTFNSAANRFDARKLLVLEEVNIISTAFLRADFLTERDGQKARALLKEYVDLRMNVADAPESLEDIIQRSETLNVELWNIIKSYPKDGRDAALTGRFADSINKMFDTHKKRIVFGTQYRIHSTIWLALVLVGTLALAALGFQFGLAGGRRYHISFLLALSFSAVLLLILDLDRPAEGSIQVSQLPMQQLYNSMQ